MPYVSVAHIKDRTWSPISYHLSSPSLPKLQRQTSAPCTQRAVNNSKPSLKRSTSRGYRTTLCSATRPPSPRSHPSPKTVRFKGSDGELESVCLFRARGRPSSIPTGLLSDTETESEWDSTAADSASPVGLTLSRLKIIEISPIPSPFTAPESNVHLESVSLLPAWHPAPPLLRGVVRVRNISYQKQVVARFTTDNWTMTNCESQAQYVSATSGDDNDDSCDWDRFAFTISLGGEHSQFANAPESCTSTLLLAVRYTVPGVGEWWDNNGGDNFRVVIGPPQGARHRARLSDHVGRLAL